jgi:hypothetical protein
MQRMHMATSSDIRTCLCHAVHSFFGWSQTHILQLSNMDHTPRLFSLGTRKTSRKEYRHQVKTNTMQISVLPCFHLDAICEMWMESGSVGGMGGVAVGHLSASHASHARGLELDARVVTFSRLSFQAPCTSQPAEIAHDRQRKSSHRWCTSCATRMRPFPKSQ